MLRLRVVFLAFIAAFISLGLTACGSEDKVQLLPREELLIVTRDGTAHNFMVEMALTPAQQARGLMYRTALAPMSGMLFPKDPPEPVSFWMHNTYIPLDLLFIRADGLIAGIQTGRPLDPTPITSPGAVAAVLEIAGGEAERLGIFPGDMVKHPFFQPPQTPQETPQ